MSRAMKIVVGVTVGLLFCFIMIVPAILGSLFSLNGGKVAPCANPSAVTALEPVLGSGQAAKKYFDFFSPGDQVERKKIAALIVKIGANRGYSARTIEIAVATAIQESGLRNLPYGDLDSLGVYQQRPSQDWGTPAQITNPSYAINKFYDALSKARNRDSRKMIDVAIEVQRPNPYYYQRDWAWDDIARDIVSEAVGKKSAAQTTIAGQQDPCESSAAAVPVVSTNKWQAPLDAGSYTKTSPFSMRFNPVTGVYELHNGVDLAAPEGTPIRSVTAGTVSYTEFQSSGGNVTWVQDNEGHTIGYGHQLNRAPHIKVGTEVKAGEVIGYVGSTGGSTGNHLHFYVMTNDSSGVHFIEPEEFMRERGVIL